MIYFKSGKKPLKDFLGGGGRKAGLHLNWGGGIGGARAPVEWPGRRPLVLEITRAPGLLQGRAGGGWRQMGSFKRHLEV